jgi:hypothetical protein
MVSPSIVLFLVSVAYVVSAQSNATNITVAVPMNSTTAASTTVQQTVSPTTHPAVLTSAPGQLNVAGIVFGAVFGGLALLVVLYFLCCCCICGNPNPLDFL